MVKSDNKGFKWDLFYEREREDGLKIPGLMV